MALQRLSPGVYRDTVTGKVTRSAGGVIPKAKSAVGTPSVTPKLGAGAVRGTGSLTEAPNMDITKPVTDGTPTPIDPVAATPTPPVITPEEQAKIDADKAAAIEAENQRIRDQANMLFPNIKGYEENASYVEQKKTQNRDLENILAARGLTGSGFETESMNDLNTKLYAAESDRVQGVQNTYADRLKSMLEDEATRKENISNEQWNRLQGLLTFMQNASPMTQAMQATTGSAGLTTEQAAAQAKYLQNLFKNTTIGAGGGGGGGGGGSAPYIAPYPDAPSTSATDYASLFGNMSSNNGYLGVLNNLLSGLTSYGK